MNPACYWLLLNECFLLPATVEWLLSLSAWYLLLWNESCLLPALVEWMLSGTCSCWMNAVWYLLFLNKCCLVPVSAEWLLSGPCFCWMINVWYLLLLNECCLLPAAFKWMLPILPVDMPLSNVGLRKLSNMTEVWLAARQSAGVLSYRNIPVKT